MVGVDYVFHAAALKQVPSCEFHLLEAVETNILGAESRSRAAIANEIKRCVVLSMDKAVYPINAMGMSKLLWKRPQPNRACVILIRLYFAPPVMAMSWHPAGRLYHCF